MVEKYLIVLKKIMTNRVQQGRRKHPGGAPNIIDYEEHNVYTGDKFTPIDSKEQHVDQDLIRAEHADEITELRRIVETQNKQIAELSRKRQWSDDDSITTAQLFSSPGVQTRARTKANSAPMSQQKKKASEKAIGNCTPIVPGGTNG